MGCDKYFINGSYITFSEGDDDYSCLCTFPNNDKVDEISPERVRSLALFGAAVVMKAEGNAGDDWIYLPADVPQWIRDGIDAHIQGVTDAKD